MHTNDEKVANSQDEHESKTESNIQLDQEKVFEMNHKVVSPITDQSN